MAIIGLDIGTTSAKAVAYSAGGVALGAGRARTPWNTTVLGVEMDADALFTASRQALSDAADAADEPITAVGITSMAESGILIGAAGKPVAPVIAWHDARDAAEVGELAEQIGADEFGARTGKPLRGQWSLTKVRWLQRHHQLTSTARRRFNVAEWIVRGLGGEEVTELSLACRTGLLDVGTLTWWMPGLDFAGIDEQFMPPRVTAGTPVGRISAEGSAGHRHLAGAVLTLAGHDHQAAAVGAGAAGDAVEFDSCGTAEALVRTVASAPSERQRQALAQRGITTDASIQPGCWSLLGGTEGGLAMQRTLGVLGIDRNDLAQLDEAGAAAPASRVEVAGLGTAALTISAIDDDTTPAQVWRATVQAATDDAARLHQAMDDIVGPVREVVAAGGWTNSSLFMQTKRVALGPVRRSQVKEAGTRGAAVLAARATGVLGADELFAAGYEGGTS